MADSNPKKRAQAKAYTKKKFPMKKGAVKKSKKK